MAISRKNLWEEFARKDAESYILTGSEIDFSSPEGRRRFFASGEDTSRMMMDRVAGILPGRATAVDIGSGIGRLAFPHADLFDQVRAVDVSPTMLKKLQAEAAERGVNNIRTFEPHEAWDIPSVDYVYSYIVFQHIADFGVIADYVSRVSRCLIPDGIAQLHFDTRPDSPSYRIRNILPDFLLPSVWRQGIRRVRRNPEDLRLLFREYRLDVEQEIDLGQTGHFFILRKSP